MSSSKAVKGYIYQLTIFEHPCYYCDYLCGNTRDKSEAHIYTKAEIKDYMQSRNWAPKSDGKWLLVYE